MMVSPSIAIPGDSASHAGDAVQRAGFDMTFSPPKSVSIQALVAGDTTRLKRCVKLAHAVPLLGDQVSIDRPVRAADQGRERTVIAVRINAVDPLVLNAADAWAET